MELILGNGLFHQEVTLNMQQEADIDEMWRSMGGITAGMEATRGWAFCHPPIVEWNGLGTKASRELEYILKKYVKPFRWAVYEIGMKKKGIVPYVMVPPDEKFLEDAGWLVPVVPKPGTGYIRQYYDYDERNNSKLKMVYKWYWFNRPGREYDPSVQFKVFYEPDIHGNYTSPAATMLRTWKMVKIVQMSAERAVYQASHMPQFLIHNPPKGRPGDEKFQMSFGEEEEIELARKEKNQELEKAEMSRNANRAAIAYARSINHGGGGQLISNGAGGAMGIPDYTTPVLNSETFQDVIMRQGDGVLDRLVHLDDYWTLGNPTQPVLLIDPLKHEARADQVISTVVDFPYIMAVPEHAQHSGNFDAQITFARDRMKEVIATMNEFLAFVILEMGYEVFKRSTMEMIGAASRGAKRRLEMVEMRDIKALVEDISVQQQCTPLITFEVLDNLLEKGVIDQKTYWTQASHITGIDESAGRVQTQRTAARIEDEKLKLEKERLEFEKTKLEEQMKLEREKIKAAAKAAELQAKAKQESGGGAQSKKKKAKTAK